MYWGSGVAGLTGSFCKKLGNGDGTFFWSDIWVGERSLKEVFPRLFRLSCQQEARVYDMGVWIEGSWNWEFRWGRVLSLRNKESFDCLLSLVDRITPSQSGEDTWIWNHAANGLYEVSKAYSGLIE